MFGLKRICIFIIIIISIFALTSCGNGEDDISDSVAMITTTDGAKASSGIAVGIPGESTKYVLTVCTNLIKSNGAIPKTVNVSFDDEMDSTVLGVVCDYSTEKNLALIELSEENERLKGALFEEIEEFSDNKKYRIAAYGNTGEKLSNRQKTEYSLYDVNIRKTERYRSMQVYDLDFAYDSGAIGGALINKKGDIVGILSYSKADDYSYAISSDTIISFIAGSNADYMLKSENDMRIYIMIVSIIGILILLGAIGFTIYLNKKTKSVNSNIDKTQGGAVFTRACITGVGGVMDGTVLEVDDSGVVIGRDYNRCKMIYPLEANGISSVHCIVRFNGSNFIVRDLNSSYGTFLDNNVRIQSGEDVHLAAGSRIYLARRENTFELTVDFVMEGANRY